jgi:hypothetical protein
MVVLVVGVALRQRKDYHTPDFFIQVRIAFLSGLFGSNTLLVTNC